MALNGGRWSDYMNSEFDTARVKNHSTPIFLGADRQYLGSNVIYQTTGANDSSSPLGSFAGQSLEVSSSANVRSLSMSRVISWLWRRLSPMSFIPVVLTRSLRS